jgi:hypothetical protein
MSRVVETETGHSASSKEFEAGTYMVLTVSSCLHVHASLDPNQYLTYISITTCYKFQARSVRIMCGSNLAL